MSFKKSLKYLNDIFYQMDHIWEAPSRLKKSQALILLKKSAIILRPNTSCCKNSFFREASFKRLSRPQILMKSKKFKTQKIAKGLSLMLSFEIFEKDHF